MQAELWLVSVVYELKFILNAIPNGVVSTSEDESVTNCQSDCSNGPKCHELEIEQDLSLKNKQKLAI